MGAKYYNDILCSPDYFSVESSSRSEDVLIRWVNCNETVNGTVVDTMSHVCIWRNDELIAEVSTYSFGDTLEFTDQLENPDYYRYKICQVDEQNQMGQLLYGLRDWLGGAMQGIVIVDLDLTPITGPAIETCLQNLGYTKPVYITQNVASFPLESTVDAVFVCLGIYPNNHVLSDGEAQLLKTYLEQGGRVYMEGGDTWYFDTQTVLHTMFNISPVGDGTGDLSVIIGQSGTFTEGMSFYYGGENSWIDHINPISPAFTIFSNQSPVYNCAVAYDAGIYKTIGASFEMGGLSDAAAPSTKDFLMNKILEFFDVAVVPVELISFTASAGETNITLNWSTATEINNLGFDVERSSNNQNFQKIGFVEGKGTTTEISEYSYTDNSLTKDGIYYYRLMQHDFDGSYEYTNTIEIDFKSLPLVYSLSQNYPNPFNPSTKINYQIVENGNVKLTVFDMLGREVKTLVNKVQERGKYEVVWNGDNDAGAKVSSGVYFYRFEAGDFVASKKMIMVK